MKIKDRIDHALDRTCIATIRGDKMPNNSSYFRSAGKTAGAAERLALAIQSLACKKARINATKRENDYRQGLAPEVCPSEDTGPEVFEMCSVQSQLRQSLLRRTWEGQLKDREELVWQ